MPILTTALFRLFEPTALDDVALGILLEAAEAAIDARVGPLGTLTERRRGGGQLIFLSRTAASVTSVTERYGSPVGLTDVLLDSTDYTLLPDKRTLRREWMGVHRTDRWTDDVIVAYQTADDTAERQRVAIALVKLDLTHNPGLTGETIGTWSEQYNNTTVTNYNTEREMILASLYSSGAWFA